jgi:hypothetical protein
MAYPNRPEEREGQTHHGLTKKKVQRRVIGGRDRDAHSSNVANHMADHTGHRRTCSSAGVKFASREMH